MSLIDPLFLLINLLILVAVIAYFFNNLVIANVSDQIKEDKKKQKTIKKEKSDVEADLSMINVEIKRQSSLCDELSDKISKWEESFKISREELIKETDQLREVIKGRRERQRKFVKLCATKQALLPDAIKKSETELKNRFLKDVEGKQYIDKIFQRLSESLI